MAAKVIIPRARAHDEELYEDIQIKVKKYSRGDAADLEVLKDKKLKGQLVVKEQLYDRSAKAAAKTEKWLLPSEEGYLEAEGLEKTWHFKQEAILNEVDNISSWKAFDMVLDECNPYMINYTANGCYMLLAGRKGHLATVDTVSFDLVKELQLKETVRDAVFLHNEHFFAAAQKKYVYIYNKEGIEVHCLKEHVAPLKLQFLDKHFLLASINKLGQLHYQDTTTGKMVANYKACFGRADVMRVNPYNAVIGLGQYDGKVTMWKPTSSKPIVTMLAHRAPITAVAFHAGGHLMATSSVDRKIKLWDVRKFEVLHTYNGQAQTLDFSQKGLLAVGSGSQVQIWRDSKGNNDYQRYMKHGMVKGYQVGKLCFRPYEDVLGIGHSMGVSSILVPGAGEPNFDTWIANPFETSKQRKEKEIHALLDKLQPETIMLDPNKIGTVAASSKKGKPSKYEIESEKQVAVVAAKNTALKKKTKGRSKPSKVARKKEEQVIKAKRQFWEQQKDEQQHPAKKQRISDVELPKSLQRFSRKA